MEKNRAIKSYWDKGNSIVFGDWKPSIFFVGANNFAKVLGRKLFYLKKKRKEKVLEIFSHFYKLTVQFLETVSSFSS